MTTPLQKAAQAMIDRWDSPAWKDQPHTAEYVNELRKALDAELQQAVGPVLWITELDDPIICKTEFETATFCEDDQRPIPVYLHPPQQAAVTSGEREVLLHALSGHIGWANTVGYAELGKSLRKAADMLEADDAFRPDWVNYRQGVKDGKADAQRAKPKTMGEVQDMCIAALQRDERAQLIADCRAYVEKGVSAAAIKLARRAADMLESDVSLINEGNKAQQVKRVPMTSDDLYAAYIAAADQMLRAQDERVVFAFARAIEDHHGIGGEA